jgi:threonine synthase
VAVPEMLKCVLCGREYETEEMMYTCPSCGIDGTLDVLYDYQQKKKELSRQYFADLNLTSLWRYSPILPVSDSSSIPSLEVGWTPLYESAGLASKEPYRFSQGQGQCSRCGKGT